MCMCAPQRIAPQREAARNKVPAHVAARTAYSTPMELNACFQRAVRSMPQEDRPDDKAVRRIYKHCLRNTDTSQQIVAAANMEFGLWCEEGNEPEEFNLVAWVLDTLEMLMDDSSDY